VRYVCLICLIHSFFIFELIRYYLGSNGKRETREQELRSRFDRPTQQQIVQVKMDQAERFLMDLGNQLAQLRKVTSIVDSPSFTSRSLGKKKRKCTKKKARRTKKNTKCAGIHLLTQNLAEIEQDLLSNSENNFKDGSSQEEWKTDEAKVRFSGIISPKITVNQWGDSKKDIDSLSVDVCLKPKSKSYKESFSNFELREAQELDASPPKEMSIYERRTNKNMMVQVDKDVSDLTIKSLHELGKHL